MNWPEVPLSDVARIVSGATPRTSDSTLWNGGIAWATPKDLSRLESNYLERTERTISKAGLSSCAATLLPKSSVLLSSRAPIGLVAINRVPVATNQGFKSFVPKSNLDSGYLFWWLKHSRARIEALGSGATFKEISKAVVSQISIPLPPVEEQRRIAEILDKADAIRRKWEQFLTYSNELLKSVFLEMFGDPVSNSQGWPLGSIRDLVREVKYGTSQKASKHTGKYKILRMGNITYSGQLDLADLKFVDIEPNSVEKYTVRKDDILFNRTNSKELVGKTTVFDRDETFAYAGYLVRARVNEYADPYYISGFLNSDYGKFKLQSMCKSIVGMANINAQEFQNISILIPPISRQKEYRDLRDFIRNQSRKWRTALEEANTLAASCSQLAFRGEL